MQLGTRRGESSAVELATVFDSLLVKKWLRAQGKWNLQRAGSSTGAQAEEETGVGEEQKVFSA